MGESWIHRCLPGNTNDPTYRLTRSVSHGIMDGASIIGGGYALAKGAYVVTQRCFAARNSVMSVQRLGRPTVQATGKAISGESSYNRFAFEKYKTLLRTQMEQPYVVNPDLRRYVNRNYKPYAKIGNGSTAAAIRYELRTGERVFDKLHSQKGNNMITTLEKWLANNPASRPGDQAAAENIIKDLYNALGE